MSRISNRIISISEHFSIITLPVVVSKYIPISISNSIYDHGNLNFRRHLAKFTFQFEFKVKIWELSGKMRSFTEKWDWRDVIKVWKKGVNYHNSSTTRTRRENELVAALIP